MLSDTNPPLTITQSVSMVESFFEKNPHPVSTQIALNSLTSEVGELFKEHDKSTGYGQHAFEVTEGFVEELGDVLFNTFHLASEAGVDANKAFLLALEKYQSRVEKHGHMGSGK